MTSIACNIYKLFNPPPLLTQKWSDDVGAFSDCTEVADAYQGGDMKVYRVGPEDKPANHAIVAYEIIVPRESNMFCEETNGIILEDDPSTHIDLEGREFDPDKIIILHTEYLNGKFATRRRLYAAIEAGRGCEVV